jgi:hypothetical protein
VVASLSLPIDPHKVLDVPPGASLQEIRDAYRQRVKLYHPDVGGEEWMFRILNQAYEYLSTARVMQTCRPEPPARPASSVFPFRDRSSNSTAAPPRFGSETESDPEEEPEFEIETENVRPGVKDVAFDPNMVVDVEKLWIRYRPTDIWTSVGDAPDERFLSCSLNIAWPGSSLAARASTIPDAEAHLLSLGEVVEEIRTLTATVASNDRIEDDRFIGWLSYASVNQALLGFWQLRRTLHARGFRVKEWTRDLIIPRDWR